MKFGTLTFFTTVILFCALPIPVRLAAQNASSEIIPFDAPGAISFAGSFDGTFPGSINNGGTITGIYIDANTLYHGFLRSPAGEFITLDAPGAGTSVGTRFRTFPSSVNINASSININNRGATTGNYVDSRNVSHGFLRSPAGEFTTFEAPGGSSVAASGYGTFPESINDAGFVRSPSGKFTTFDAPGPTGGAGCGILPESINDAGAITGHYTDAVGMNHGFLRIP